jgi:glycosyltransferase involved in cell wall biosynthesis
MRRIRLAVLFYRLGPYHMARLRAAASRFELTAVEYSGEDSIYSWDPIHGAQGFKRIELFQTDDFNHRPRREVIGAMDRALKAAKPEVVAVPGWGERCSLAALLWCARNKAPVVVMSDSPEWIVKRHWWKELVKHQLLTIASAGLAAGSYQRDYLGRLGLARDRIFLGFDVVDNDYFSNEAAKVRKAASEFRGRYRLPETYFMASSRFVPKKNLDGLLKAYARYRQLAASGSNNAKSPAPVPWHLVLLGDGPLRPDVIRLVSELGLEKCVHLPGFRQIDELPIYYALAKAFILASVSETWGLTTNEAMACGLPVVVSSRCGCSAELVVEGKNGTVIDPDNVEQIAGVMLRISKFPEAQLLASGQASRNIIADWGTDRFASSLESAAETALRVGPRSGTLAAKCFLNVLIGN